MPDAVSTEPTPECDAINPELCACTAAARAARAAETTPAMTPAVRRARDAMSKAHPGRPYVACEADARLALAAALDGDDGGDARVKVIHDAVCDGRSMDDCDGLCGAAFDALRASILGDAR